MKMKRNFIPDPGCQYPTPASRSNQPYQQQIYMDLHTNENRLAADLVGPRHNANPSWQVLPEHRAAVPRICSTGPIQKASFSMKISTCCCCVNQAPLMQVICRRFNTVMTVCNLHPLIQHLFWSMSGPHHNYFSFSVHTPFFCHFFQFVSVSNEFFGHIWVL